MTLTASIVSLCLRDAKDLITVKLAEADDVAPKRIRSKMREPYRTLLGDFRHGIEPSFRSLMRQRVALADALSRPKAASQHGHAECVSHSCWRM
ncbi:putative zinc-binding metallopeptidase [Burkholderia multivorans]|uniref:putative zinc-binding metallopeptidase n=1 Tax=Burkholderia multivorans TaxID=87883 RepID=UPI001C24DCCF|nr:putative zinc-binding metallopeptidase [Burkholderia multivorans]